MRTADLIILIGYGDCRSLAEFLFKNSQIKHIIITDVNIDANANIKKGYCLYMF
jgi:hypothetical protein